MDHNDGTPPMSLKFVRSHPPRSQPEVEIGGAMKDVDEVAVNLSCQFAAAGHFEHRFSARVEEVRKQFQAQYEREVKEIREKSDAMVRAIKAEFELRVERMEKSFERRLKEEVARAVEEATQSQWEEPADAGPPDYYQ